MSDITIIAIGIAAMLFVSGVIYQLVATRRDRRTLPLGRFVDVDGRRMHVYCAGAGTPTVILEAGIAASSISWAYVQREVAAFTQVCSYDRAGLGWSDADGVPISAPNHAARLQRLTRVLQLTPPFVLVGHSYGSFVVRAYAERYPEDVAGLVLVDPIYSNEWVDPSGEVLRRLRGGVFLSRVGAALARIGFVRACLAMLAGPAPGAARGVAHAFGSEAAGVMSRLVREVQKLPPESWPGVRALWSQPKCFIAMAQHLSALPASARALASCTALGDIPIVVITGGHQPEVNRLEQQRLASSSSRGRQVMAAGSGHWVHLDEPALVVDAIRELVER